jgi:pyruvate formate lyase activating enzyme
MTTATSLETSMAPHWKEVIPVAGIIPLTTIDYPNRLALVIFTQGCPWRCGYCHNAALRPMDRPTSWQWRQVCGLLEERRGFLEAVVFSGGEPTLHPGLGTAMSTARGKGYLIGLHTAGMFPERLAQVLPWLHWVGLDIKAPLDQRYAQITGDPQSAAIVLDTLNLLRTSGISFQLRTTVGPGALSEPDFEDLCHQLRALRAPAPLRQEVHPVHATIPLSNP